MKNAAANAGAVATGTGTGTHTGTQNSIFGYGFCEQYYVQNEEGACSSKTQ